MKKSKIIGFAVGPIATAILGFASLPILAWYVSAEDIGRISMLQVVVSFVVILSSLGLDQAYVREYHEAKNRAVLLRTVTLPGLMLMIFVVLGIFLYSPTLLSKSLFAIDNTAFSVLIVICLFSSFLSRFLSLILRMHEKGLAFSMSQVLPKLLFLLIIGFYVLDGALFTFHKLLIAQTISIIVVFFIYTWNTRTEWLPALSAQLDSKELKQMLSFGLPLIFGGVSSWALMAMDRVFLRNFSSFEELGIYSIAASVAAAAGIVSGIFTTIWAPTVFKWAATGENLEKVNAVSEHVLAAVYFILCLGGMFSWLIPYILPKTYNSVQYLVVSCMVVPLFYMVSETTAVGIAISRKTRYSLFASLIAAGVNGLGNYLLVPKYGAAGAAVSTAFAFWVFVVCRTEFCCLVWRKVPRLKLYFVTFISLSGTIIFALVGNDFGSYPIMLWVALFVVGLAIFKDTLELMKSGVITMCTNKFSTH